MSEPDIIVPFTQTPKGPEAWVWVEEIRITRDGSKKVQGIPQLEDAWHLNISLRASLATEGSAIMFNGVEQSVTCPIPSVSYDLADLLHDQDMVTVASAMRDICLKLANGKLKPLP